MNLIRNRLIIASMVVATGLAHAADHGDSPSVREQGNLDINDVYVFTSPENSANTVLVMTVSPVAGITGPLTFAKDGLYQFAINNKGDAKADKYYQFDFSPENVSTHTQRFTVTELNSSERPIKRIATGVTTETSTPSVGGKVTADDFDDPFFFDLLSFRNSLNFCTTSARNFFAGLNTLAIVLEVPTAELQDGTSTSFGVFARTIEIATKRVGTVTTTRKAQFDRMGRPAINTVLVKSANKDRFNKTLPKTDAALFKSDAVGIIQSLGNTPSGAQSVGDFLFPDILTFDSAQASAFPNGRNLPDDVIDAELNLITNGGVTTDCVSNDSTFRSTFPYVGVKNP